VVGANWSLALYGRQDCLLASIRDSRHTQIDNKQAFYTARLCYGSVKTIRSSYSNEDTKDEERVKVWVDERRR
jgi:hypothetical protein